MRLGLLALPLLALPLACSFASQGEPEVGGDDEVANTASETDAEGSDDVDDEFGTDQGTSSDSPDDESEVESTTDTTTTDDDPSDSSEATTEETTEETTEDTEETTEDTAEDTTDTGMNEPYYGACPSESSQECLPGEVCKTDVDFNDTWHVCSLSCDNSGQCPDAGGLPLICISYFFQSEACHINCEMVACPDGMTCKSVNGGLDRICAYQG